MTVAQLIELLKAHEPWPEVAIPDVGGPGFVTIEAAVPQLLVRPEHDCMDEPMYQEGHGASAIEALLLRPPLE